jgi:hypothetical protein
MPPPSSAGRQHYLTAITKVDEKLVEIIDVEKVLAEIVPYNAKVSRDKLDDPVLARPVAAKCCWWMTPAWPWRSCAIPCRSWGEAARGQ